MEAVAVSGEQTSLPLSPASPCVLCGTVKARRNFIEGKGWICILSELCNIRQRQRAAKMMTFVGGVDVGGSKEAAAFITRIEELYHEGYDWAGDTLSGILETVQRTGRVTEGQRRAVDNIENSRGRK
jgi:hypothetical protein